MVKIVYLCAECLAGGTVTDCGSDSGEPLVCPVNPDHKMFLDSVDKRE